MWQQVQSLFLYVTQIAQGSLFELTPVAALDILDFPKASI